MLEQRIREYALQRTLKLRFSNGGTVAKAEQKKKDAQELVVAVNRVMVALDETIIVVGRLVEGLKIDKAEAEVVYEKAREALRDLNRLIKKLG